MFAGGLMALTVLTLLQSDARLDSGARIETRVGEIGDTKTTVMVLATPNLRLHWAEGPDTMQADLGARMVWRPVPLLHTRPLFLETFGMTQTWTPTPRTQRHLELRASYGEQDYTSLSQQFATQPTLPLAMRMFMVDASVSTSWRASHRTTLEFRLAAGHRRTLDGQTSTSQSLADSAPALPTQTNASATPALRFAVSRRSEVGFSMPVSDSSVQGSSVSDAGPMNLVGVQPQLVWSNQVTRSQRLHIIAGLSYVHVLRGSSSDAGYPVTPLAQIRLDSHLLRRRTWGVSSSSSAGTMSYLDPVLGRMVWRGIVQGGLEARIGLRWRAGSRFNFTTDLSRPSNTNARTDGTLAGVDASLRYLWTHVLLMEVGARFNERGPRLSSDGFAWRGREMWAFLALYSATSVPLTTSRPPQSMVGM